MFCFGDYANTTVKLNPAQRTNQKLHFARQMLQVAIPDETKSKAAIESGAWLCLSAWHCLLDELLDLVERPPVFGSQSVEQLCLQLEKQDIHLSELRYLRDLAAHSNSWLARLLGVPMKLLGHLAENNLITLKSDYTAEEIGVWLDHLDSLAEGFRTSLIEQ